MLSIEFFCPLPNGLHARPAWALKRAVQRMAQRHPFYQQTA